MIRDWYLLNDEARWIVKNIESNWINLLAKRLPEEAYQNYLHQHAGFFFRGLPLVISKLRLGADFTTDFIVASDQYSNGLVFEFIEIETPYHPPFTKKGNPSARLSTAIQQIQNWRMWLRENRGEAKKLFPSIGHRFYRNPNFKFTIIIGRRSNSHDWLEHRQELGEMMQINIRSFDNLTDCLRNRIFQTTTNFFSMEEANLSEVQRNMLANPFAEAYSDAAWRKVIRELSRNTHFIVSNAEVLLRNRQYSDAQNEFVMRFGAV